MSANWRKPLLFLLVLNLLVAAEIVSCRVVFDAAPGAFHRAVGLSLWVFVPIGFLLVALVVQMLRVIGQRRKEMEKTRPAVRSKPRSAAPNQARRKSEMKLQLMGVFMSVPVCFLIFRMLHGAPVLAADFKIVLVESMICFGLWFCARIMRSLKKADLRRIS